VSLVRELERVRAERKDGSIACRSCAPTGSIPTCSMSAPARCSIMRIRATWCSALKK
jgi:hypothetical protein